MTAAELADAWWEEELARQDAARAEVARLAAVADQAGYLELANVLGSRPDVALVVRCASDRGMWRVSRFDELGPAGHSTHATAAAAVACAWQDGYRRADAGAVDRVCAAHCASQP